MQMMLRISSVALLLASTAFCTSEDVVARKILVVSPHPDDDVLGCGGAIAHHIAAGDLVTTVYVTSGEMGMEEPEESQRRAQIREQEGKRASEILGVQHTQFLRLPDGHVQANNYSVSYIEDIIARERPAFIYAPHDDDGHGDHQEACKMVRIALDRLSHRPDSYEPVLRLYEVWTPLADPTYVEDISDVMDIKMAALAAHASQLAGIAYDDGVTGLNRYRGVVHGVRVGSVVQYAEAFGE